MSNEYKPVFDVIKRIGIIAFINLTETATVNPAHTWQDSLSHQQGNAPYQIARIQLEAIRQREKSDLAIEYFQQRSKITG